MMLPSDIEKQILEYLHLEYGESSSDPDALKIDDLKYEGEFLIDDKTHYCWSFPSTTNNTWVSVYEYDDSYAIGTIESPNANYDVTYDYVYIEVWEHKKNIHKVPLKQFGDFKTVTTEEDFTVTLKSGDVVTIYVEVDLSSEPYTYSVDIDHNGKQLTVYSDTKGVIDYNIDEYTGIKVVVGGERWL